ncbi:MAG: hypothetical protein PHE55_10870 [Methylococcaceae bacterium]|nr:hypothetical protein [Methylococcaceae bacterium]
MNADALFRSAFSCDFLHSVANVVAETYPHVVQSLGEIVGSPHKVDALPFVRAKLLDERLEQLALNHGYAVQVNRNKSHNWHYVLITSGEVTLSAASSPKNSHYPRPSSYRKNLAAANEQHDMNYSLFGEDCAAGFYPNGCYGVLSHCACPGNPSHADHAHIIFPSADWKRNVSPHLDLFNLFAIDPKSRSVEQEEIEENFGLGLRQQEVYQS